jgi:hypothetical protein
LHGIHGEGADGVDDQKVGIGGHGIYPFERLGCVGSSRRPGGTPPPAIEL